MTTTTHAPQEAEALDTQLSSVQDAINTKQRVVDSLHATMAAHQRALDQQHVWTFCLSTLRFCPRWSCQEAMEGLQVQLGDALHHGRQAAQRRRAALAEAAALLHRITDTMLEYTTS